jgi:transposase InsO family protein
VHAGSRGRYGAPRIHAELRRRGRRHGRKRVARLMRRTGVADRAAKRWKKTTIADPAAATRADAIRRDFTADAGKINSRWCGDIAYVGTWEGWLYLLVTWNLAGESSTRRGDLVPFGAGFRFPRSQARKPRSEVTALLRR